MTDRKIKRRLSFVLGPIASLALLTLLFQNCGQGFDPLSGSFSSSSLGDVGKVVDVNSLLSSAQPENPGNIASLPGGASTNSTQPEIGYTPGSQVIENLTLAENDFDRIHWVHARSQKIVSSGLNLDLTSFSSDDVGRYHVFGVRAGQNYLISTFSLNLTNNSDLNDSSQIIESVKSISNDGLNERVLINLRLPSKLGLKSLDFVDPSSGNLLTRNVRSLIIKKRILNTANIQVRIVTQSNLTLTKTVNLPAGTNTGGGGGDCQPNQVKIGDQCRDKICTADQTSPITGGTKTTRCLDSGTRTEVQVTCSNSSMVPASDNNSCVCPSGSVLGSSGSCEVPGSGVSTMNLSQPTITATSGGPGTEFNVSFNLSLDRPLDNDYSIDLQFFDKQAGSYKNWAGAGKLSKPTSQFTGSERISISAKAPANLAAGTYGLRLALVRKDSAGLWVGPKNLKINGTGGITVTSSGIVYIADFTIKNTRVDLKVSELGGTFSNLKTVKTGSVFTIQGNINTTNGAFDGKYSLNAHLLEAQSGKYVRYLDNLPLPKDTNTFGQNEFIRMSRTMTIPSDLPTGRYALTISFDRKNSSGTWVNPQNVNYSVTYYPEELATRKSTDKVFPASSNGKVTLGFVDIGNSTPTLENRKPFGYVQQDQNGSINGWAYDPDSPAHSPEIHIYYEGLPTPDIIPATTYDRPDVVEYLKTNQGGHQAKTSLLGFMHKVSTDPRQNKHKRVAKVYALDAQRAEGMNNYIGTFTPINTDPNPPGYGNGCWSSSKNRFMAHGETYNVDNYNGGYGGMNLQVECMPYNQQQITQRSGALGAVKSQNPHNSSCRAEAYGELIQPGTVVEYDWRGKRHLSYCGSGTDSEGRPNPSVWAIYAGPMVCDSVASCGNQPATGENANSTCVRLTGKTGFQYYKQKDGLLSMVRCIHPPK